MAQQTMWMFSDLPEGVIEGLESSLSKFDPQMEDSTVFGRAYKPEVRNSQNAWIPAQHWIAGFIWHYVNVANRENFQYDISHIDGQSIQYTRYGVGQYYNWHQDAGIATASESPLDLVDKTEIYNSYLERKTEEIRKLSVIVQLSNPEDYEGGNVQFMTEDGSNTTYFAPRQRGTVIVFDSRAKHRVLKIKKGIRKSLVAWCMGPRWK